MSIRPAAAGASPTVRSLAVGSALLSVATFVLTWASGWSTARAGVYALAVPLAASLGGAVILAAAFTGAAIHFSERVARGRFALPATAAAAGCVLASLWLVAPSGFAPLREQGPGPRGTERAAAGPVIEVPAPDSARTPTGRTPRRPTSPAGSVTEPGTVTDPGSPTATPPFIGPPTSGARPVSAPTVPDVDPAPPTSGGEPAVRPRTRPGTGIVRTGTGGTGGAVNPTEPVAEPDVTTGRKEPKGARLKPGKRCGQRTDHCATPFGRAVGYSR